MPPLRGAPGLALANLMMVLMLAACAGLPQARTPPLLHLSPASLGRELALVQRLEIRVGAQSRTFDVALEIDANELRVVMLQFGQTVARLVWDGHQLQQQLAPGWPAVISAAQVLNDLQMLWWPTDKIRAVLPAGWALIESAQGRELRHGDQLVTSLVMVAPGHIELKQFLVGYLLHVHSKDAEPEIAPR